MFCSRCAFLTPLYYFQFPSASILLILAVLASILTFFRYCSAIFNILGSFSFFLLMSTVLFVFR